MKNSSTYSASDPDRAERERIEAKYAEASHLHKYWLNVAFEAAEDHDLDRQLEAMARYEAEWGYMMRLERQYPFWLTV